MTRTLALTIALAVGALSFTPTAQAQDFNCNRATTATEMAICADGRLRAADREMARLYAIKLANDEETCRFRVTVQGQREWLRQRGTCGMNGGCLARIYSSRIRYLQNQIAEYEAD
jgi:uncharacterized protein